MLHDIEFHAYGAVAVVTFLLWIALIISACAVFWNSRLSLPIKRFASSVRFALKRNRPLRDGDKLYRHGYIYRWAVHINARFNKNRS